MFPSVVLRDARSQPCGIPGGGFAGDRRLGWDEAGGPWQQRGRLARSIPRTWTRGKSALRALADDDAVDRAGEAARVRYESVFAPALALQRLRAVYREVVGT